MVIELKHDGEPSGIYLSFDKDAVIQTRSSFSDATRDVLSLSIDLDFSECKVECPNPNEYKNNEWTLAFCSISQFLAQEIGPMIEESH